MNIAILTDTYFPQINGVSISIQTFCEEFEKYGHHVLIIGPKVAGAEESTEKLWRIFSIPFPFQKEYRIILPISRKLKGFKEKKIDIIHGQTPFAMGYLSLYLSRKYSLPLIHTYHTYFEKYMHYLPFLPKKLGVRYARYESRRFYNRCDHIVVPSSPMAKRLSRYGVEKPISVIPTGVNSKKPRTSEIRTLRDYLQMSPSERYLIFVGRLGKEKNVYFLLESFKLISDSLTGTRLLIVGDGPEKSEMMNKARELGILSKIRFFGYIPHQQVFSAYAISTLILFPSKTETQGLSLLEGLSMGVPAIGINAMGVRDILSRNEGGFLTRDSVKEFSEKAIELLTDETLYRQKQKEAIAKAEHFSSEEMAKKMIHLYEDVIAAKKN